ncbi:MAG: recombinase family protein [Anaerolineae bacterium]|nr:recombinase family protein [Anaerolineae bacterium]
MTHAIIYDRASTKMQQDNWSRENAREVGIRIAEQNGFTWEYIKEIGSGTTLTGRPKMMSILDRIAAGEIQIVIVQDLDRLARPVERATYETIRNIFLEYGVIVYTHNGTFDFADDDSDFVADINMAVAKKERNRTVKRIKRSFKAKADAGKYIGGQTPLGYKAKRNDETGKSIDIEIDPSEAELVQTIFNTLEETGGNLNATAKALNRAGYTGKEGQRFWPNTLRNAAQRRLYAGLVESSVTETITYRKELQIISTDQFERVQALIRSRSGKSRDMGRRGRYIFTGFVVCGGCGGSMVAANFENRICYQCQNRRHHGKTACKKSKTYSEYLILPPIVEFLAGFIQEQIDIYTAMENAAAAYGKSVSEEALEAAIKGELASVRAGKDRLVDAISLGILSSEEAATKLDDLREQERRLIAEMANIGEKAAVLEEWQQALETLKNLHLSEALTDLAEHKPVAFRRLLSIVFKPNSLRVKTIRTGKTQYHSHLTGYELTDIIQTEAISFGTKPLPA